MARRRSRVEAPHDPDCFTIGEFCERNRISKPFYYKLRAEGRAPRELRLGSRVLITKEDAVAWRASLVA